jgi:hypothetical protein
MSEIETLRSRPRLADETAPSRLEVRGGIHVMWSQKRDVTTFARLRGRHDPRFGAELASAAYTAGSVGAILMVLNAFGSANRTYQRITCQRLPPRP